MTKRKGWKPEFVSAYVVCKDKKGHQFKVHSQSSFGRRFIRFMQGKRKKLTYYGHDITDKVIQAGIRVEYEVPVSDRHCIEHIPPFRDYVLDHFAPMK